jgi:hypothetical protein
MKILQIESNNSNSNSDLYPIFGLGDDNKIYRWDCWKESWVLYSGKKI